MPSPSGSLQLVTRQTALGEFYEFSYNEYQFVGEMVFPTVNVAKQSGPFGKLEVEEMLKLENNILRAPGTGYARDRFQFATDSYACLEYGYEEVVDRNEAAMYSDFINDPFDFATQRAVNTLLRAREKRIAALVFDTTTFGAATAFGINPNNGTWNVSTATPISDIEEAAQTVFDNCGLWPNAVIMNRKAFRYGRLTTEVTNRINSAGSGFPTRASDITPQQWAEAVDIDNVYVAGGAINTAAPGATASISQLWGNHCMVARVATTGDMRQPCLGRSMNWAEDGGSPMGTVETYFEDQSRSDIVRVRHQMDEKRLLIAAGCLINSVLT